MSQSKISKMENGRVLPSVLDVERVLHALDADEDTVHELVSLARIANTEFRSWRPYQRFGLHHKQRELAAYEAEATEIRFFLPAMITGLLQTPEYARASLYRPVLSTAGDRSRALALRLERQTILHDPDKRLMFVLTESAVRWRLCEDSVMAVQLDHIASLSLLSNVHVRVIPTAARVQDGPLNGFVIHDERLVTVETFTGEIVLREPKDIGYYRQLFDFFSDSALGEDETRSFLAEAAASFRGR
jgi:uncharacterized protein DUF5753/helix-turn-helix protein